MFYLIPVGGSKVILTEFCKVETGNFGDGFDVSHNLKSGCIYKSGILSTILSSAGIHDSAK